MRIAPLLMAVFMVTAGIARACDLPTALAKWKDGDIEDALICTRSVESSKAKDADSKSALLMVIAFVKGQYRESLEHYRAISRDSPNFKSTAVIAAQAAHFLHDFSLSRRLIKEGTVEDPGMVATFELFERQPLSIDFLGMDIIPFDYSIKGSHLPTADIVVEGSRIKGIVDTGGNYLAMSPSLADKLGIKSAPIGRGRANEKPTNFHLGVASFSIGKVMATNVPVYVAESLEVPAMQGTAVFGTTFLSNFLVTIDFLRRRLILSTRDDPAARGRHLSEVPPFETSMPFYLWFDHFMFAKGSLDVHSNLNFFLDSGVTNVRRGREAALRTATSILRAFGYTEKELSRPFVDLHGALGLGTLRQDGLLAIHNDDFDPASFGGITIHGMISHAFLERYVWTIDFENRTYGFSK
jgi:predicted aspartyl protease